MMKAISLDCFPPHIRLLIGFSRGVCSRLGCAVLNNDSLFFPGIFLDEGVEPF